MTMLEERLSSALTARADLVRPEDLRPAQVPSPASHRRRPRVYVLAAAAAVGLIALPFVTQWLTRQNDPPVTPPSPDRTAAPLVREAIGDVDGDGYGDRVSLRRDQLAIVLASSSSGVPLTRSYPGGRLLGLADVGEPGRAIVVSVPADQPVQAGDRDVLVLTWRGDGVREVPQRGFPLSIAESLTVWIADDLLYSGQYEGTGDSELRVQSARRVVVGGALVGEAAGTWCWDPVIEPQPRACTEPGDRPDVGSAAGLPALFPSVPVAYVTAGEQWRVDVDGDGAPDVVRLTRDRLGVSLSGSGERRVRVPAGTAVRRVLLDLGSGTTGLLLARGNGVGTAYTVVRVAGEGLQPVGSAPSVPLLDGIPRGGSGEYLTWVSAEGRLYTRLLSVDDPLRTTVWAWGLPADRTGKRTLEPSPIGQVCLDERADPVTYGTC